MARYSQLNCTGPVSLGHEEHNEVLVEVIEVAGVVLVEIVGKLGLCVILGGNPPVEIGNTQGVPVENNRQNAIHRDGRLAAALTGGGDGVNLAGTGEVVVGTRTLPIRNSFAGFHLGVNVVESIGLEVHIGRPDELGQIDGVLEVIGSETLFLADIKQSGHSGRCKGQSGKRRTE